MSTDTVQRIEWSCKEIAQFIGVSYESFRKPRMWRRYGGKKRGGRIVFSEAARQAILKGAA